jgi:SynChlorMet cassette radical SAM/SPASM protein ScmE
LPKPAGVTDLGALERAAEPVERSSVKRSPKVMRSPRSVDIEITGGCNLRCRYCYHFGNGAAGRPDLSTGEWLRFFEELGEHGVMSVGLGGGEPFLRRDLAELVDGIVANRMRFSLVSNATLISEEMAARLAATNRCDGVQVSLDGSRPVFHDACRGAGSWHGALAGIRRLQREGVPLSARVTIHRYNVHDLEATLGLLLDDLALPSVSTNAVGYLGLCREEPSDLLLTVSERMAAMDTLLRLAERYGDRLQAQAGPLADARAWHRMEQARLSSALPQDGTVRLVGCGCVFDRLAVRSDGAYIPCLLLPELEMGRVGRDSLSEVWQRGGALDRLRRRMQTRLDALPFCRDCRYSPYCTGDCPGLAYARTGDTGVASSDSCLRRFLLEGGAIPLGLGAPGRPGPAG